jgi:hypothetical protein
MRSGTMGTMSSRLGREERGGGGSKSRPTRPEGMDQEAHNRGGLEDNYRIKTCK